MTLTQDGSNCGGGSQYDRNSPPLNAAVTMADWGKYAPAIDRWAQIMDRPAPDPTDGQGRLNPALVEWMMGYPEGWVDGISRTGQLKALGNAIVPHQAAAAWGHLLGLDVDRQAGRQRLTQAEAEAEAEAEDYGNALVTANARALAAERQVTALTERWRACNQLLRSAHAIAQREADHPNTSNWTAWIGRVSDELAHNPFAALSDNRAKTPVWLDELDPDRGNYATEPDIQCSIMCAIAEQDYARPTTGEPEA